jgi:hypothetical protein
MILGKIQFERRIMKRIGLFLMGMYLLGISGSAWGDGVSRLATQAEKDFTVRVLTALSRSLSKPLPGFEARDATAIQAPDRTGLDETEPMRIDYTVAWINPQQAEAERARQDEAIQRAANKMNDPAMQAKQKVLNDKITKVSTELGQAFKKNDQAKVAKLQKEMEKLGQELNQLGQAQTAVLESETQSLTQKSRLEIRLTANDFYVSELARLATELKPVGGNTALAYHDPEGKYTDRMTVLVGTWKRKDENDMVYYEAEKAALPHTRVQAVTVTITGDSALARQVLAGVDWKALQKLMK